MKNTKISIEILKYIADVAQYSYIDMMKDVKLRYGLKSNNYRKTMSTDFINKRALELINERHLQLEHRRITTFGYDSIVIFDKDRTFSFSFMSEINLSHRRRTKTKPAYLDAILGTVNKDVIGNNEQISLFSDDDYNYDRKNQFNSIFGIGFDYSKMKHYVIIHKVEYNQIVRLDAQLLSSALMSADTINLIEYISITPDIDHETFVSPVFPEVQVIQSSLSSLVTLKTNLPIELGNEAEMNEEQNSKE